MSVTCFHSIMLSFIWPDHIHDILIVFPVKVQLTVILTGFIEFLLLLAINGHDHILTQRMTRKNAISSDLSFNY